MNQYLEIIRTLSLKNEATQDYISLCELAKERPAIDGYVEKHHILPKCICSDNLQIRDENNLVRFSAKEHFTAHLLLSKMFEGIIKRKMLYALSALSFRKDGLRILDADDYAITKEASRLAKKGIPLTDNHRQKIRDSFAAHNPNKGRSASIETRIKQSIAKKGKPHVHSEETRKKLSIARIGLIIDDVTCPHCNKIGKPGALGRWHFNNCKARRN